MTYVTVPRIIDILLQNYASGTAVVDMTKLLSVLPIVSVFATCSFVSLSQQLTCQSNGCVSCCTTSDSCSSEHTFTDEEKQCIRSSPPLPMETPQMTSDDLQHCPFDVSAGEYGYCPNSRVDNRTRSVGDYGKPNWVGAEFHSLDYNSFSMTVMWELADALPDLSPVQGYEIRIYEREAGHSEIVRHCVCVTNPSVRNISDIRNDFFMYNAMSQMIVEVQSFPSLIGEDERTRRRNCSLLIDCSTMEECSDDCYSWPQGCLNLTSYSPVTCTPQLYSPPMNVMAVMSLVNDNITINSDKGQLSLSWEPPEMDYALFPVPNMYYVTIESAYSTLQFKAVRTTRIMVSPLNFTSTYTVLISAYVPCSGLSQKNISSVGCGNFALIEYLPSCEDPTPPLHGRLGDYDSTALHSTVTFQCDSGWSPSEPSITTCGSTESDSLEWVPDPANHTCAGML